jgi:hypothetical protein
VNDNSDRAVGHTHHSVTDYATRLTTDSKPDQSVTPSDTAPIPRAQQTQTGQLSRWRAGQDTRTTGFSSERLGPGQQGW